MGQPNCKGYWNSPFVGHHRELDQREEAQAEAAKWMSGVKYRQGDRRSETKGGASPWRGFKTKMAVLNWMGKEQPWDCSVLQQLAADSHGLSANWGEPECIVFQPLLFTNSPGPDMPRS